MNTNDIFLKTDGSSAAAATISSSNRTYYPDYGSNYRLSFNSIVPYELNPYTTNGHFTVDNSTYSTYDFIIESSCPSCQLANIDFNANYFDSNNFGGRYQNPVAHF